MSDERFGRSLSSWLSEDAAHRVPDHLGELLAQTAATRQRPWWSSLERWLPMNLTTLRAPVPGWTPQVTRITFLLILAVLVVALVALAIGSRRPTLDPFGPARNGTWVTSADGDIYTLDPATAARTPLVSGTDNFDFSPIFARDGSKLLFLRSDGPISEPAILSLMVMNADGSGLRALTPPTPSLDWFDWSPAGTQVAYMTLGQLYVVGLDGAPPIRIETNGPIHFPTWLPPDGSEILLRRDTHAPAIIAVRPDGTALREVSRTLANNQFDYQSIAVAPDGSAVTFTRWSRDSVPRVYALDPATGEERVLPTAEGTGQRGAAVFSPDGLLVAYARTFREGAFQIVVANTDGSGGERPLGPRIAGPPDGGALPANWAFTPDGTALIVRYGSDATAVARRLPLDGSPGSVIGSGAFEFVDIQRLAP